MFNLTDLHTAENGHSGKQCAGISRGGTRSMIGKTSGFIAYVEALEQNELVVIVSFIATPAVEKIPNQLRTMSEEIVKLKIL
jgi:hypothetical protein